MTDDRQISFDFEASSRDRGMKRVFESADEGWRALAYQALHYVWLRDGSVDTPRAQDVLRSWGVEVHGGVDGRVWGPLLKSFVRRHDLELLHVLTGKASTRSHKGDVKVWGKKL